LISRDSICPVSLILLLATHFFFSTHSATTEIYTLSLHDALPICSENLNAMELREWQQHTQLGSWFLARLSTDVMTLAREIAHHRSEEHTSELQSHLNLVCRLLLEKKNKKQHNAVNHNQCILHK